jgi:rfaE bifunctional protein nucleotidyltransferase chain/domain
VCRVESTLTNDDDAASGPAPPEGHPRRFSHSHRCGTIGESMDGPNRKIVPRADISARVGALRAQNVRIVFTNGCFDLVHAGHVEYLYAAKRAGNVLIVGLNSDASVARAKGPGRPTVPQSERAEVIAALEMVDLVTIFDEDTPLELIKSVRPDVLVKGADWAYDEVVGRVEVEAGGGQVLLVPLRQGVSTTALVERIRRGR